MLSYDTRLPYQLPVSDPRPSGISPTSPYAGRYGRNHQDVMDYVGSLNAESYGRAAEAVNNDYAAKQRAAQQELALAGLRQMAQSQQNQRELSSSRMGQATGFASSLLGGLFD